MDQEIYTGGKQDKVEFPTHCVVGRKRSMPFKLFEPDRAEHDNRKHQSNSANMPAEKESNSTGNLNKTMKRTADF